jgi:hypothetical protein
LLLPLVERLLRIAHRRLRLTELRAQLDRALILRDRRLEATRPVVAVAIAVASADIPLRPGITRRTPRIALRPLFRAAAVNTPCR